MTCSSILLDEITEEYHKEHPLRIGRPVYYPDWLPALLQVLEARLEGKIDRLPTYSAEGREAQYTAKPTQEMDIE